MNLLFGLTALLLLFSYWRQVGYAQARYIRPIPYGAELDTRLSPSETSTFLYNAFFDTLFKYGANGELVGNLAEHWVVSEGGKKVEIVMRAGAHFADGSPVKASDVKYSVERLISSGGYAAEPLRAIEAIDSDDVRRRVRITLRWPNPRFLIHLTDQVTSILKKGQESGHLNGSGPFVATKVSPAEVIMKRNESYHGTVSELVEISMPVMSKEKAIEAYLAGKVDDLFHYYLSKDDKLRLQGKCEWSFELLPSFRFVVLKKATNPALYSQRDRNCLISLLDRDQLINAWDPSQPKLNHYLPKGIFGGDLIPHFKEPALCETKEYERIARISLSHPIRVSGVTSSAQVPHIMMESLARKGIHSRLKMRDSIDDFFRSFSEPDTDLYAARFTPRVVDVESFVYIFFGAKAFFPLGISPKFAQVKMDRIAQTADRREKSKEIAKLFEQVAKEEVFVPIHQFEFAGCRRPGWQITKLPVTGFIHQDMNLVRKK